jgi:predicted transcriptional regulator
VRVLLMSIKPTFSDRIFNGKKRFELRRTAVRIEEGDVVVVYASSPVKAIVGAFTVSGVKRGAVRQMWIHHGSDFGVSHDEYTSYFEGADEAYAIEVGARIPITPVSLDALRLRYEGFRPPQSFMYWARALDDLLGKSAVRKIRASQMAIA